MRLRRAGCFVVPAVLLAIAPAVAPAAAQVWSAEVGVGRAVHALPVRPAAGENVAAQLRYGARHTWFSAGAGAPVAGDGAGWLTLQAGAQPTARRGRFRIGADLESSAYGFEDRTSDASGSGYTAAALPAISAATGPLALGLRAGVLHHGVAVGDSARRSRTLRAVDASVSGRPTPALELSGEARYLHGPDGGHPYLGAGVRWSHAAVDAWAHAGRWTAAETAGTEWGVGLGHALGRGYSVHAAVRREATDPLFLAPPRRSWALSVRRAFGGPRAPAAVVAPVEAGRVVLRLRARPGEPPPSVAGDFNGWTAVPMTLRDGFWVASLALPPGAYRYAFRRADGAWFVPPDAVNPLDDGMGGVSALLLVR